MFSRRWPRKACKNTCKILAGPCLKTDFVAILRVSSLLASSGGSLECRFCRYFACIRPLGLSREGRGMQMLSLFCVYPPSWPLLGRPWNANFVVILRVSALLASSGNALECRCCHYFACIRPLGLFTLRAKAGKCSK